MRVLQFCSIGTTVATTLLMGGQMETITFTVPAPGTYVYQCDVHPDEMRGYLIVE